MQKFHHLLAVSHFASVRSLVIHPSSFKKKKKECKINTPNHVAFVVYQLAKLRMLQFKKHYDTIDTLHAVHVQNEEVNPIQVALMVYDATKLRMKP